MISPRTRRWFKRGLVMSASFLGLCFALFLFVFRPISIDGSIPQGWGYGHAVHFQGTPVNARPLKDANPPQHPFLAATNANNMHGDAFASDVHVLGGPLGHYSTIKSYAHGPVGGECASVTFDSRGNIVAVCATFSKFSLLLMRPSELRPIAQLDLPPRASNKTFNLRRIMEDTSGGAYFFLDNHDRAVLVDAKQKLKIISQEWKGQEVHFKVDREYDLRPALLESSVPGDVVTAVLPDWQGFYWFVSRRGIIGTVQPDTGRVSVIRLPGEEIENSFAVDSSGAYIVSDAAMYGMNADPVTGAPKISWRESYERSSTRKSGTLSLGSGTTPTLLGSDLVAITDNANPRINILVYHRGLGYSGNRLICKVPIFSPGNSSTENSLIGWGKSLIAENNYGYDLFPTMMFGRIGVGGTVRVDVNEDETSCRVVWENREISQTTVPKLSAETGLVYLYTKDPGVGRGIDAYYLTAVELETGKRVFRVLAGTGVSYDNNWAPITLGSSGCAYVGVLRGLVQICDGRVR
jgi:hypothetical protein